MEGAPGILLAPGLGGCRSSWNICPQHSYLRRRPCIEGSSQNFLDRRLAINILWKRHLFIEEAPGIWGHPCLRELQKLLECRWDNILSSRGLLGFLHVLGLGGCRCATKQMKRSIFVELVVWHGSLQDQDINSAFPCFFSKTDERLTTKCLLYL